MFPISLVCKIASFTTMINTDPFFSIGYLRILCTTISFYYAYDDYITFFALYSISELLDMADGHAARYLNQCMKFIYLFLRLFSWAFVDFSVGSKFGAVLDMITDRCSTMMLIIVLTDFYPERNYMYLL